MGLCTSNNMKIKNNINDNDIENIKNNNVKKNTWTVNDNDDMNITFDEKYILIVGRRSSGKTAMLNVLDEFAFHVNDDDDDDYKFECFVPLCAPTNQITTKVMKSTFGTLIFFDTPGYAEFSRPLVEQLLYRAYNLILFIVDSTDNMRLPLIRADLIRLCQVLGNNKCEILIVFTKSDQPDSLPPSSIENALDFSKMTPVIGSIVLSFSELNDINTLYRTIIRVVSRNSIS